MNFSRFATSACFLLVLASLGASTTFLTGCLHINVMGRDVPDSEYQANYDRAIARERQHLEPESRNEKGLIPSWDEYWCEAAATTPPTAQSRRLRRYIIDRRRVAGLQELTCGVEYNPGSNLPGGPPGDIRFDHYYKSGDPRIFKW